MSHFGRAGPPDIKDTYSLLVLNITFRTTADDLYPLFDRYGKVVDIFIPRDKRTGESRGFAFVRYKHADEAQKAIDRLDGVNVHGRDIIIQFAKYGRSMERIQRGRITSPSPKRSSRSDSRSPRRIRRHYDDYYDRDVRHERHDRYRYAGVERDSYRKRSLTHSRSRSRSRGREHRRRRSPSRSPRPVRDTRGRSPRHSLRRSSSREPSHEIRNGALEKRSPLRLRRSRSKDSHSHSPARSDRRSASLEPEKASSHDRKRKSPQGRSSASPRAYSVEKSIADQLSPSPDRSAEEPNASPAPRSASDYARSPSPFARHSGSRTPESRSPSPVNSDD
ncbi:hypothetical protein O6H91_01G058200 [Diphasiastrum complanatum]|uniref:Uncharacterized protein n=1 Tax=Diphasiastrum complanatum TaxID=34168 RepID=A0ACC2ERN3_DIPCM|nr:hypothetical protein O6H91_01G058200 [Diphasiastrum complanatum]